MPSDKYQLVLAEGCDTYQIGEAFKENPTQGRQERRRHHDDVVLERVARPPTVENFLSALLARDSHDRAPPAGRSRRS